jgi:hypothetical protein
MANFNIQKLPIVVRDYGLPLETMAEVGGNSSLLVRGVWSSGGRYWTSDSANNNTKTIELACAQFVLPYGYAFPGSIQTSIGETLAQSNVTLAISAQITAAAATSANIDAQAYVSDLEAGAGSDIVTTAAQTLGTSWAVFNFTLDGTTLLEGSALNIFIRGVVNDSGGSGTIAAEIGDVRLLIGQRG